MAFPPLGRSGQDALTAGRGLIVGVGGLGSWVAELLARAGVGFLRLVDDDVVEAGNLHRQALYTEADAAMGRPKVEAAAAHLSSRNSNMRIDARNVRASHENISDLARDVGVIVDGTDNFATRYLLNDYCVKHAQPWIFAGVIAAEAQIMTIVPHQTPCLRCILPTPPRPCTDTSCRQAGVLGPAVSMVASLQAVEAMKILAGRRETASPLLLKMDLWNNSVQQARFDGPIIDPPCPCCELADYEFLEP
jgi:adenylyltransferase/sulfurtransferase